MLGALKAKAAAAAAAAAGDREADVGAVLTPIVEEFNSISDGHINLQMPNHGKVRIKYTVVQLHLRRAHQPADAQPQQGAHIPCIPCIAADIPCTPADIPTTARCGYTVVTFKRFKATVPTPSGRERGFRSPKSGVS
eukprot:970501-Pyramimonas_sp.AAC.2